MTLVQQPHSRPNFRQVASTGTEDPDRWVLPLSLAAAALAAGWLLIGVYLYFRAAGPIVPGVRVGDTEVGGLTVEQAAVVIDNGWNRDRVLHVSDGNQVWEGNPLEFGLWVDPNATARKAYTYGRGENRYAELFGMLTGAEPPEILPEVVFSPKVAAKQLSKWGALIEKAPEPPHIAYENEKWVAKPGADGLAFDEETTLKAL